MKKQTAGMAGILSGLPPELQIRTQLSFAIAHRIETLMRERGLNKKQFAIALGRSPSEITKWLSGEHNFTVSSIAMLTAYFKKPIIVIPQEEQT